MIKKIYINTGRDYIYYNKIDDLFIDKFKHIVTNIYKFLLLNRKGIYYLRPNISPEYAFVFNKDSKKFEYKLIKFQQDFFKYRPMLESYLESKKFIRITTPIQSSVH